jgi:phosphoadenosine phosphosulfate reductase
VYSVTTIDPPDLLRFIHAVHPDVVWRQPKTRFFRLLEKNGPPTAHRRWCCRLLKESFRPPEGGVLFTGVRAQESPRRAALCKQIMWHREGHFPIVAPIFDWSEDDVWHYIDTRAVPYCALYDAGKKRLGCVGCPMNYRRAHDVQAYPYIAHQWHHAISTWWYSLRGEQADRHAKAFGTLERYESWYWSPATWPRDESTEPEGPCQLMFGAATDEPDPKET